ncbi:MAG: site-2 protease family protein [Cyanobacteria bacterium J06635_13]
MFINYLFSEPIFYARVVVILILSVSLHELGHGFAAMSQGDDTPQASGHITMNPVVHMGVHSIFFLAFAGIAWGQMPVNPRKFRDPKWGNILVSAAGPLTNVLLAMIAMLVINVVLFFDLRDLISLEFFFLIARLNFVLFLFNLIPIPPLDGFHIASEFSAGIRKLGRTQIGLALFMILFISGASRILFTIADKMVGALII